MEHLQATIEDKDGEIENLKEELLEKEKYIFECEARINESLKKCQEYAQKVNRKEMEIEVLKTQN